MPSGLSYHFGTLAFEYFYAKRTLNACDAVIERLKMKDE